jgi:tetratricopeptide (TPR) repeat protein
MLIYSGLVGGLFVGALWIRNPNVSSSVLPIALGAGTLLGLAFAEIRRIGSANWRSIAAAAVATILVGVALYYLEQDEVLHRGSDSTAGRMLGVHLLLGLPFFYLLTFCGRTEESEAEFAAICASMAIGVWLINLTPSVPSLALVIPATLYALYTRYTMPGLRVFKHTLRGFSYHQMGRIRPALKSFRRALELDPKNKMALDGLAKAHSRIDPRQIANDPETRALLDLDLCLNRVGRLLFQQSVDSAQLEEVRQLLELIAAQSPDRKPETEYWHAVADMRAKNAEWAANRLANVLDPSAWTANDAPSRETILFPAWQLALLRSSDLTARVGKPQLALPARRMEAIAAVERILAQQPQDTEGWEMKRFLYEGVTEAEYNGRPPVNGEFDGFYARELGLALINDAARWRRGIEFLRLAAMSLPQHAPSICVQMAQALERSGEIDSAQNCYKFMRDAGLYYGPKNLPEDERNLFFAMIKRAADEAAARNDPQTAIANLKIFAENDRAGIEVYRQLAEMHERAGDALGAMHFTNIGLVYNSADRDLLARKDKYYYSVTPEQILQAPEHIRNGLDLAYCMNKAREILGHRNADLDSIDWALHLTDLARKFRPDLIEPKLMWARCMLWKGERDRALQMLEDIHEKKPEKLSGSEEDAWFRCVQILGDLYLNDYGRADLAVPCYMEFRNSPKSGADTLFKLGQAYEALGDAAKACRFYEQVTGYTEHPKYYDAQEAMSRLRQGPSTQGA